jgi:hypothetical protein
MSPARGPESWVPNPGCQAGVGHLTLLEGVRRIRRLRQAGVLSRLSFCFLALLFLPFFLLMGK